MAELYPQQQGVPMMSGYGRDYNASIVELRLDTEQLIEDIYRNLSGYSLVPEKDSDGKTFLVWKKIGESKLNELGVSVIMEQFRAVVNSQTVQGNFDREQYDNMVYRVHKSLALLLIVNYPKWDMKQDDYPFVMDMIMNCFEMFISRLIENKERESYIGTQRIIESNTTKESQQVKGGGFSLFNRKGEG